MPSHKKTQKRQTRNQYELNRPPEPPPFTSRYSEPKNIAPEKKSKKKSKSKPVEPVVSNHKKTQQRQTRNQYELNRPPEPPPFIARYSEANNIAPEKKYKKKKRSKSKPVEPVVQVEKVVPPKVARPNPLEVKARAAARAAAAAAAAAAVVAPKRKPPPLKPRGAKVRVEPPPEPPQAPAQPPAQPVMTAKRVMPKPKPRVRMTRKAYNRPVNMAEFMMAANKPMKKTIPKMSRKSPAFFNIPNGTNVEGMKSAVTEVANSFRLGTRGSMNPLLTTLRESPLRETPNHPLLRGSFMTRKLMSQQAKGRLNAIKEEV
jgi:hypothetical protein